MVSNGGKIIIIFSILLMKKINQMISTWITSMFQVMRILLVVKMWFSLKSSRYLRIQAYSVEYFCASKMARLIFLLRNICFHVKNECAPVWMQLNATFLARFQWVDSKLSFHLILDFRPLSFHAFELFVDCAVVVFLFSSHFSLLFGHIWFLVVHFCSHWYVNVWYNLHLNTIEKNVWEKQLGVSFIVNFQHFIEYKSVFLSIFLSNVCAVWKDSDIYLEFILFRHFISWKIRKNRKKMESVYKRTTKQNHTKIPKTLRYVDSEIEMNYLL